MNTTILKRTATFKSLPYYGRMRLLRDGMIPVANNSRLHLAHKAFDAVMGGDDYWVNLESKKHSTWTFPPETDEDNAKTISSGSHITILRCDFRTRIDDQKNPPHIRG